MNTITVFHLIRVEPVKQTTPTSNFHFEVIGTCHVLSLDVINIVFIPKNPTDMCIYSLTNVIHYNRRYNSSLYFLFY